MEKNSLADLGAARDRELIQYMCPQFDFISPFELRMSNTSLVMHEEDNIESKLKYVEIDTINRDLRKYFLTHSFGSIIATVMITHPKYLAIGTSKGVILLFNHSYELIVTMTPNVLSTTQKDSKMGVGIFSNTILPQSFELLERITAIDINYYGDKLICGYSNGTICLWDIVKNTILKYSSDIHKLKIVKIQFININVNVFSNNNMNNNMNDMLSQPTTKSDDIYILSVDASGIAFRSRISKVLWAPYSMDTECMLDGSTEPVLNMNALTPISATIPVPSYLTSSSPSSTSTSSQQHAAVLSAPIPTTTTTTNDNTLASNLATVLGTQWQLASICTFSKTYIVQVFPTVRIVSRWNKHSSPSSIVPSVSSVPKSAQDSNILSNSSIGSMNLDTVCMDWAWGYVDSSDTAKFPIVGRIWGKYLQLAYLSTNTRNNRLLDVSGHGQKRNDRDKADDPDQLVDVHVFAEREVTTDLAIAIAVCWAGRSNCIIVLDTIGITLFSTALEAVSRLESSQSFITAYIKPIFSKDNMAGYGIPALIVPNVYSTFDRYFYVLSCDSICSIQSKSWQLTVESMFRDGRWLDGLVVAAKSSTSDSMVASSSSSSTTTTTVTSKIYNSTMKNEYEKRNMELQLESFIKQYVDIALVAITQDYIQSLMISYCMDVDDHLSIVAGVCIDYCTITNRMQFLFDYIYNQFLLIKKNQIFIKELIIHIITIKKIKILPSPIITEIIQHCIKTSQVDILEKCIICLYLSASDMNNCKMLLFENELYSGYFYVYMYGSLETMEALESVINKMLSGDPCNYPSPMQATICYKILLYLSSIADGLLYPLCKESVTVDNIHIKNIIHLLTRMKYAEPMQPIGRIPGIWQEKQYPYLYALCLVDCHATFHCMSLLLRTLQTRTAMGTNESISSSEHGVFSPSDSVLFSTEILHRLHSFAQLCDEERNQLTSFNDHNSVTDIMIQHFFTQLQGCPVELSKDIFHDYLAYCSKYIESRKDAEQYVLDYVTLQLPLLQMDNMIIIDWLQRYRYWRAVLYVCHTSSRLSEREANDNNVNSIESKKLSVGRNLSIMNFRRAIQYYESDNNLNIKMLLFDFINEQFLSIQNYYNDNDNNNNNIYNSKHNIIKDKFNEGTSESSYRPYVDVVVHVMPSLVKLDIHRSIHLIINYLLLYISEIITSLENYPDELFKILDYLVNIKEEDEGVHNNERKSTSTSTSITTSNSMNSNQSRYSFMSKLSQRDLMTYVKLLSIYRPMEMLSFLKLNVC